MHNNKKITFYRWTLTELRRELPYKINTQSQLNSTMQFNIFHIPMLCVIDDERSKKKNKMKKCIGVVKKVQATN